MPSIANINAIDDILKVKLEVKLEEDKENENPAKPSNFPTNLQANTRRRHLSLVDTNRDGGRTVSVSELGGWTVSVSELGGWTEVEEVIAEKGRLGSVVDSLQKHRRNVSWAKVEEIHNDVDDSCISQEWTMASDISLRGHDWNDLVEESHDNASEELEESVFQDRSRFLSVADSLKKLRSISSREEDYESEGNSDFSTRDEFLPPVKDESNVDSSNTTYKSLPEDVVDIDEDNKTDYGAEIVIYLRKLEKSFILNDDFLEDSSVSHSMRSILVDWLVQVQHHLKLSQETLYLAVSMLDLVLDRRDVDPDKLQLVGITSLLVATKLEEYYPVEGEKLLHLTENSYKWREVLEMELVLIEVLDFQLYIPSTQVFLLRYTQASLHPADPTFLKTCQYLLDSHLSSPSHPCLPPSLLAAAAVLTAGLLYFTSTSSSSPFTSTIWTPTLIYYTMYSLDDLLVPSMSMLDMVLSAVYTGATTKYTSMSQHSRLVLQPHLQREVVLKAWLVLEGWARKESQEK